MMTEQAFDEWATRLAFTEEARAFIQEIRHSSPSRLVQGRGGNVIVRYPSRKMGCTIQGESVRGEWAAVLDLEYDPDVLEYYDQPCPLRLRFPTKAGPLGRLVRHVPDLFVLRTGCAGFEECKPDAVLLKRAQATPARYFRAEDGSWHCPPAERLLASYGLYYRIRNADAINWAATRNAVFLEDYLRAPALFVAAAPAATIRAFVSARPALRLADLLHFVTARGIATDVVYQMIVLDQLYVDLRTAPLAEPDRVPVFLSAALACLPPSSPARTSPATIGVDKTPGARLTWDGEPCRILHVGVTRITLQLADDRCVDLSLAAFDDLVRGGSITAVPAPPTDEPTDLVSRRLLRAGPADQAEAVRRYTLIAPYLAGQRPDSDPTPARTIRLWRHAWRTAQATAGCGLIGLLPRGKDRGNRAPRLPAATLQVMDACITQHYETFKQRSVRSVYGTLLQECARHRREDPDFRIPSYQTFRRHIKLRAGPRQTRLRAGSRAAYQIAPFYWELSPTTPRHGDRPWEIVHLDHTPLDVQLVYEESGRPAGTCWLSLATDAYSRRFLALYLSYDPPSYRSCMMVLRLLVQRWGRLPQTVVVDNAPEFHSVYFEMVLARYEVTKKARPAAHPRHGAVCERLFGTTTTQLIHALRGNTQLAKQGRRLTKQTDPARLACWTLALLYEALWAYASTVYDAREHPTLGRSPREAYAAGLTLGGERAQRVIAYDEAFRMQTLPSTAKGTAAVDSQRGVKIMGISYWHDAFRDPRLVRQQVPVRYDPFDIGIAYAFVRDQWVLCHSEHYATLAGHSERARQLITQRLRERARSHGRSLSVSAAQLALFLGSIEAQEVVLTQRLRDGEGRRLRARLEAGTAPGLDSLGSGTVPAGREQEDETPADDEQVSESAVTRAAQERQRLQPYGSFL